MFLADAQAQASTQVAILAFDGCLTTAVTGVVDALQIANLWAVQRGGSAPFVTSILATRAGTVRGSGNFAIPAAARSGATALDVAIVPPIIAPIRDVLTENAALLDWLRTPRATLIASVCTGAFFLAEAGLLAGRRATTNPAFADAFRRRYASVELAPEEPLIEQGHVVCAGSASACFDLALYLIDRFANHELAVLVAKSLCVDMQHRSQLPYFLYVAPKDHGDSAVLRLQLWIEEHYPQPLSTPELARRAGMGQRTLHRRFRSATGMAPIAYLHRVRTEAAKRQLENSNLSVDQITANVGYEDLRSFSRLFRSLIGLSPTQYRARFGTRTASLVDQPTLPFDAGACRRSRG